MSNKKMKFSHGNRFLYSQRSVHCYHLVIVVWIKENVIDVALPRSSSNDCRSTSPVSGDIAVKSVVRCCLVDRQADFVKTRNFNDSTAYVAVNVIEAEVGNDLTKHDHIFESKI